MLITANKHNPESYLTGLCLFAAVTTLLSFVLYFVFLIRSFINQSQFYKVIGQNYGADGTLLYLFLGMPFYIFMYFYFKSQMQEKMKGIE